MNGPLRARVHPGTRRHQVSCVALLAAALLVGGCLNVPPPGPDAAPLSFDTAGSVPGDEDAIDTPAGTPIEPAPEACEGYVALTFDDGPTSLTPLLLDVLDRAEVPATFFNRGDLTAQLPSQVERTVAAGHEVGSHAYDHPDLLTLSSEAVAEQLARTNEIHRAVIGEAPVLFRPPYGSTNADIRSAAAAHGMVEVLWTVDSKDYLARDHTEVVERSTGMVDGGILLLHDGKPFTLEALPEIINHYHGEGTCFGRIAPTEDEHQTDLSIPHNVRAVAP